MECSWAAPGLPIISSPWEQLPEASALFQGDFTHLCPPEPVGPPATLLVLASEAEAGSFHWVTILHPAKCLLTQCCCFSQLPVSFVQLTALGKCFLDKGDGKTPALAPQYCIKSTPKPVFPAQMVQQLLWM